MPSSDNIKKYLFVVNPISGGNEKNRIFDLIDELIEENGLEKKVYQTTGEEDRKNIEKLINSFQPQVIVAAGGDGTVNLVAELILNTDMTMGIIPLGSGNGLSKDLDIPQFSYRKALELLVNPRILPIDTLRANGKFFMHIADLGFNAHVVRLFNKSKSRGFLSYLIFSAKEFYKYRTFRYQIKTDSFERKGMAFMISVANSNTYGTNVPINPEGKVNDGFFEIVIIKRFPRKKIFSILWRLMTKKIRFSPYSVVLKCREAEIQVKKKRTLQYDGEIAGRVNSVKVTIAPRSLKVIVPEDFKAAV